MAAVATISEELRAVLTSTLDHNWKLLERGGGKEIVMMTPPHDIESMLVAIREPNPDTLPAEQYFQLQRWRIHYHLSQGDISKAEEIAKIAADLAYSLQEDKTQSSIIRLSASYHYVRLHSDFPELLSSSSLLVHLFRSFISSDPMLHVASEGIGRGLEISLVLDGREAAMSAVAKYQYAYLLCFKAMKQSRLSVTGINIHCALDVLQELRKAAPKEASVLEAFMRTCFSKIGESITDLALRHRINKVLFIPMKAMEPDAAAVPSSVADPFRAVAGAGGLRRRGARQDSPSP